MNHKRDYRLYEEEGLQIRNKHSKRKVADKVRLDRKPPVAPNEVWAMDFLSNQLFDGRTIRILTIVDSFSTLSLTIDVRFRYTGTDVVATLERVASQNAFRARSVWTTVLNSSRATSISGPIGMELCWTSRWPGNPTDKSFVEAFSNNV